MADEERPSAKKLLLESLALFAPFKHVYNVSQSATDPRTQSTAAYALYPALGNIGNSRMFDSLRGTIVGKVLGNIKAKKGLDAQLSTMDDIVSPLAGEFESAITSQELTVGDLIAYIEQVTGSPVQKEDQYLGKTLAELQEGDEAEQRYGKLIMAYLDGDAGATYVAGAQMAARGYSELQAQVYLGEKLRAEAEKAEGKGKGKGKESKGRGKGKKK